jgi:hypothetical protein
VVQVSTEWQLQDEEGHGPFVSVVRNGRRVGAIEILEFPLDTLPEVTAALANGTRSALNAHVAAFLASFTSDRAAGCGVEYRFTPDPAEHTRALDGAVVRYGFRGTMRDGTPSERVIHWAGVRGEFLVLLTASAHDAGGCLPPEGTEFTTADLDAFAPLLERVVLASRLPTPGPPTRHSAPPTPRDGSSVGQTGPRPR